MAELRAKISVIDQATAPIRSIDSKFAQFKKSIDTLNTNLTKFNSGISSLTKNLSTLSSATTRASEGLTQLSHSASGLNISSNVSKAKSDLNSLATTAANTASQVRSAVDTANTSSSKMLNSSLGGGFLSKIKTGLGNLNLGTIGNTASNIANRINSLRASISGANSALSSTPSLFSRLGASARSALTVFGGFSLLRGIFRGISSSVSMATSRLDTFETFGRKMELITGDANQAQYALNEMKEATVGTAYMLDVATKSVQNFVTRGMKTEDATKSVEIWMDAVSAYGRGTNEEFESAMDAIAKMRTKGTVEMRYLNRLFAIGINPVRMYAQAVGETEAEVQDKLTNKELGTEQFLNVVEQAMREGTGGVKIVEGMAQKVATTWQATLDNTRAAIARGTANLIGGMDELFKVVNERGLKGVILDTAKKLEGVLGGLGSGLTGIGQYVATQMNQTINDNTGLFTYYNSQLTDLDSVIQRANDNITSMTERATNEQKRLLQDWVETCLVDFQQVKIQGKKTWAAFLQAYAGIKPQLMEFGTIVGGTIVDALINAYNWLLQFAGVVIPPLFKDFSENLQKIQDRVPQIQKFLDNLKSKFDEMKQAILDNLNGRSFLDVMTDFAINNAPMFLDRLGNIVELIVKFVTGPGQQMLELWLKMQMIKINLKLDLLQTFLQFMVDHPNITTTLFGIVTAFKMLGGLGTLAGIFNGISKFSDGLLWLIEKGPKIAEFLGGLGGAGSKLAGLAGGVDTLGGSLTTLSASGVVGTVMSSLQGFIGFLMTPVGALVAVTAIVGGLAILYNTYEPFRKWVDNMVQGFKDFYHSFDGDSAGRFAESINQQIPVFQASLSQVGENIKSSLETAGTNISAGISDLWSDISGGVTGLIDYITTTDWIGAFNKWVTDFTTSGENIRQGFSDFWSNIVETWNTTIVGGFNELIRQITEWDFNTIATEQYNGFMNSGENVAQGYFDGALTNWGANEENLLSKFTNFSSKVDDINQAHSPAKVYEDKGYNVSQGYANGVIAGFNANSAAMLQPFTDMIANVGAIGNGEQSTQQFTQIGATSANAFKSGFTSNITPAITEIQTKFTNLKTSVSEQTSLMIEQVKQKYENLKNELERKLTTMNQDLTSRWTSLADSCLQAVSSMTTRISNKLEDLKTIGKNKFNDFFETLQRIANKTCPEIAQIFNGMIDSMLDSLRTLPPAGTSIIQEFMNDLKTGIVNNTQGILDVTNSLVEQLKSVFLAGLGIHSPSRFGIYVANMMGEGLMKLPEDKVAMFYNHVVDLMKAAFPERFNPDELVQYLSDEQTLQLIARLSEVDMSMLSESQIAYPLIGTLGEQTSWFGPRASPGGIGSTNHGGVDLATAMGTPIAAALAGTVIQAGWNGGYGQSVTIDHGGGTETLYGHMSQILTSVGQQVAKGAQIGLVGSTGRSTGPHLHFEVHQGGSRVDPQPYLGGAGLVAGGNPLVAAIQQALDRKNGKTFASAAGINWNPSGGTEQWRSTVQQALTMLGQPLSYTDLILYAIEHESSGRIDPEPLPASMDWNTYVGNPSRGLMQLIPENFRDYGNPNLSHNIIDPLANIYAGINYMMHHEGIEGTVYRRMRDPRGWFGYATGTDSASQGWHLVGERGPELVNFGGGEVVLNNSNTSAVLSALTDRNADSRIINLDTSTLSSPSNSTVTNTFTINPTYNVTSNAQAEYANADLVRQLHQVFNEGLAVT